MKAGILIMLLATSAMRVCAQGDSSDKICKPYLQTLLPAEAPTEPAPTKWPDCESYKSYSGIGREVDYAAARNCAWQERLAQLASIEPKEPETSVFGGSAMLTVLYANGEGVTRNIPLAKRFACEAGGAPAEIRIRLEDLESREKGTQKSKFDFCDDITSGYMQGFCAAYSSELSDQKRVRALRGLSARMPENHRHAFDELIKAQRAYARTHAAGEIDTSGTARAMYEIDAEDTLVEDFVAALTEFEQGKSFPHATVSDFRDADASLNATYRSAMSSAEKKKQDYGAVQPEGIRSAERAWLRYRDLFVKFAELRYPSLPREAWLTLVTRDRTSILDGSFCDMDAVEGKCAWQGDTWKPSPLP